MPVGLTLNRFKLNDIFVPFDLTPFQLKGPKAIADRRATLPWLGDATSTASPTPNGRGWYQHFNAGSIYYTEERGAFEVHGAIYGKWASLGWEQGFLGFPLTDESTTPDGIGRYNHFEGGSIYWTPQTGAWEVHGAIRDLYAALGWERSFLGYPVTASMTAPTIRGSAISNGARSHGHPSSAQGFPRPPTFRHRAEVFDRRAWMATAPLKCGGA